MIAVLSRRPYARWKVALIIFSFILLLWFLYSSCGTDPVERSNYSYDLARLRYTSKSTKSLDDYLAVHPLRRSPMPSAVILAGGARDDENAAEEGVDFNKGKLPHDDNAALEEEHSGQLHQYSLFGRIVQLDSDDKLTHGIGSQIKDDNKVKKPSALSKNISKNKDKEVEDPESFHHLQEFHEEIHNYDDLKYKRINYIPKKPLLLPKKEVADEESFHQLPEHQKELPDDKYGPYNNWRNLTIQDIGKLSNLGKRLFLNEKIGSGQDRKYKIHVWKYMKFLTRRLIKRYTTEDHDPFEDCSVSNCEITWKDEDFDAADAVLFHLHRINGPPIDIKKNPNQTWIWLSDESPKNVFMAASDRNLDHYRGLFDWSMTYRIDSDVPVPYGRTVPLPKDQYLEFVDNVFRKKEKNVAIMSSNCGGDRFKYVKELQKYIDIDVYGGCGPFKCPGHFTKDCPLINVYKFYLAFENSNCDDYITEKVWWNSFHKMTVPVVMGSTKQNYNKILPPNSFIHIDDFDGPKQLAEYLIILLNDEKKYNQYHEWRAKYKVVNEHGYFQSPIYHFCRICEALNYNSKDKSVKSPDIDTFFNKDLHCYPVKWKPD